MTPTRDKRHLTCWLRETDLVRFLAINLALELALSLTLLVAWQSWWAAAIVAATFITVAATKPRWLKGPT